MEYIESNVDSNIVFNIDSNAVELKQEIDLALQIQNKDFIGIKFKYIDCDYSAKCVDSFNSLNGISSFNGINKARIIKELIAKERSPPMKKEY